MAEVAVRKSGLSTALQPLRYPSYAALWATTLASNFGSMIQTMAAAWVMVSISASTFMVASVQAAASLPVMLFALLAGTLADNFNRKTVMLSAQMLSLAASATLAALTYAGYVSPVLLILFTFIVSTGYALHLPTWQSSIRIQVPQEVVPAAVGLNAVGFNIARCLAPALGGWIIVTSGPSFAFLVNSFTYVGVIAALLFWRLPHRGTAIRREAILGSMLSGIRYVAFSGPMCITLCYCFTFTVCGAVLWAFIPVIANNLLGGGVSTYAYALTGFGVGALVGGMASAGARDALGDGQRVTIVGGFGIAAIIFVIASSSSTILTIGVLFLAGALWMFTLTTFNLTIQVMAPTWITGRALACYQTVIFAGLAFGSLFWGAVAGRIGLRPALAIDAVLLAGALLVLHWKGIRMPSITPAEIPDPVTPKMPAIAVDDSPHPVILSISYRVMEENVVAFWRDLQQVGYFRLRDGAIQWRVTQDLDDPQVWTETVRFRTWTDYCRQADRLTSETIALRNRLKSFDIDGAPVVRRQIQRNGPTF
jgi:predicted MFS family arabinose efflux permease